VSHARKNKRLINAMMANAIEKNIESERTRYEIADEEFENSTVAFGITPEEADDYAKEDQIEAEVYDCFGCHTAEELDEIHATLVRRCHCDERARRLREFNARSALMRWGWHHPLNRENVECLRCVKARLGHLT